MWIDLAWEGSSRLAREQGHFPDAAGAFGVAVFFLLEEAAELFTLASPVMATMTAARSTTLLARIHADSVKDAWKLPWSSAPIMNRGVSKPTIMFLMKSIFFKGPSAKGLNTCTLSTFPSDILIHVACIGPSVEISGFPLHAVGRSRSQPCGTRFVSQSLPSWYGSQMHAPLIFWPPFWQPPVALNCSSAAPKPVFLH